VKEKFFSWFKSLNLPPKEEVFFAYETFDRRRQIIAISLIIVFGFSFLFLAGKVNNKLMVDVPVAGGSLTEGIVGSPRFINPLLATSDADRDLTALTYSGLLRPALGRGYELDLAESYEMSSDGLTYTFRLRKNLHWSDGEPITANDIIFTIEKAQDQEIKSPKRGSWNGISVEKVNDLTVRFTLKKPYNFFLGNATLGILPAHLWGKIKNEQFPLSNLNTEPVGSGPYQVASISRDETGIPQSYTLKPFADFALGAPKIDLLLRFYNSDKELATAVENGEVTSAGAISPNLASKLEKNNQRIIKSPLPRTFTIFLNSSRNQVFLDPALRQALSLAVDRQKLIKDVLLGYGEALDSVLPASVAGFQDENISGRLSEAQKILNKNNWQLNANGELVKNTITSTKTKGKTTTKTTTSEPISFTIATANIGELKTAAQTIARDWSKLGIKVNLEFFEPGDLNQDVIRPRRYDALLFGEVIGRDYDLYPFWHSSQRLDPGLNIAMYANNKVDKLLEEIRESTQIRDLPAKYQEIAQEIDKDQPAVFLYQPYFLYVVPSDLRGIELPIIANPANRFAQVYKWYFKTDRVWPIFAKLMSYL